MRYINFFIFGFALGSIPFGYIFAKLKGIDIRTVGSGNIGATNVVRACGKTIGTIVFILDLLKGFLPTFIARHLSGEPAGMNFAILAAIGAILGHTFTPWLKWRGGKGVTTGLGVFIGFDPILAIFAFGVWGIIFSIFKWVSVASIGAAFALLIMVFIKYKLSFFSFFTLAIFFLVVFLHRKNIKRLIMHQEPKITGER